MCSWVAHPSSELNGTDFTVWLVCVPSCDEGEPCALVSWDLLGMQAWASRMLWLFWSACLAVSFLVLRARLTGPGGGVVS